MDLLLDCTLDAGIDTLKLFPFLFATYVVMEAIERRTEESSGQLILMKRAGSLGPVLGGLIGIVPQCGFSAAASSLYAGGLISLGTLLSVFLSTSDEMLPLLISSQVSIRVMVQILLYKALIGILSGLAADFTLKHILHKSPELKHIHDLCEDEHCGCEEEEGSLLRAALIHTLHIALFVLVISLALNLLVESFGEDAVRSALIGVPVLGIFLIAAVGLIPNCASSILITRLYLDGLIAAGQMMSGLLVGSGVGLLVLFRTNSRHLRENIKITILLYVLGVAWGLLLTGLDVHFG